MHAMKFNPPPPGGSRILIRPGLFGRPASHSVSSPRHWRCSKFDSSGRRLAVVFIVAAVLAFGLSSTPSVRGAVIADVLPVEPPVAVGIAYRETDQRLVLSINHPDGMPHNFATVDSAGALAVVPPTSGIPGEQKLASIRSRSAGGVAGGFTLGHVFCGNGQPGKLHRLLTDGSFALFATLQGPDRTAAQTGHVRGLSHDQEGDVVSGGLIVLTVNRDIWRVTSAGVPTRLGTLPAGSAEPEACLAVPNNPAKYGPTLAGKILVGAEDNTGQNGLWVVNPALPPASAVSPLNLLVDGSVLPVEDLDLIKPGQNLFITMPGEGSPAPGGGVLFVNGAQFSGMADDILITVEGTGQLYRFRYVGGQHLAEDLGLVIATDDGNTTAKVEHSTFAPMTVTQTVTVVAGSPTGTTEGNPTPARLIVRRNAAGGPLKVFVSLTGSAVFDVDYGAPAVSTETPPYKTVTIPSGASETIVNFTAFDDSRQEGTETMVLKALADVPPPGGGARYAVGTPFQQTATITTSDALPMPASWKLYDLGTLGGNASWAYGIGPLAGQTATIAGAARWQTGNDNTRAFRFPATVDINGVLSGSMTALATSGFSWAQAFSINPSGIIAGQYYPAGDNCPRAFKWTGGATLTQLPSLAADAAARDIGPDGRIVGECKGVYATPDIPAGVTRATLWDAFGFQSDLGTLAGNSFTKNSFAYAINANGRIVGKSQTTSGSGYKGYRTRATDPAIDEDTDLLSTLVEARDINDLDEVVGSNGSRGYIVLGNGPVPAASIELWNWVAAATGAQAINNKGVVIGWRYSPHFGMYVPAVWWNYYFGGYPYDITYQPLSDNPNYLPIHVVGGGSWNPVNVLGINDANWIVGWGYKNGQLRAFLLKPA